MPSPCSGLRHVTPHSAGCATFQQPQFTSFIFQKDGNGADQGPLPGAEDGCETRKQTEHGQEDRKACSDTEKRSIQREGIQPKADLLS